MVEILNMIGGIGIIILNIVPFILKKPKLLLLTAIISFIILFLITQNIFLT